MDANPWVGKNYIADTPAPIPPPFFLARIWDQDAMLVVMPSRKTPGAYVIARRKQFGPGLTPAAIDAQFAHPDTKMCVLHGCVPVCLMFKTGASWDADPVIRSLRARDMWAAGGADKVADALEAQEAADKQKIADATRDDLYNRSGDAWRTYQARTGQSTIRHNDTRKAQQRPGRLIYSNSPTTSGSTPGSGDA